MEGRSTIYTRPTGEFLVRHERPTTIFGNAYEGEHDGLRWWGFERLKDGSGKYWDGPLACEKTKRECLVALGIDEGGE